jgi:glycerate dehydrogenase
VFERTSPEEIVRRGQDAEIILTNKTPLNRNVIADMPRLQYIGVMATGYNVVDTVAARERGIAVTNVPAYSTMSVVQLVFAHLFNLAHHITHHTEAVRNGRWTSSMDFSFWDYPLVELAGRTMGIVGFGRIGSAVATAASSFGMRIVAYNGNRIPAMPAAISFIALDELFSESDVVTLHSPLTPETREMVNSYRLSLMKPTAFLINTGRGQLVDEQALANALNAGRIAGAGLDVLSQEPPLPDNPLPGARNCFITPHFAWATTAARKRLMHEVTENVRSFLQGRPRNVVNG